MDDLQDILSSIGWEVAESWEFNPDDYAVEADVSIYPEGYPEGEQMEMPKYSVDELKIDIEPMLYDLEIDEISDLVQRMMRTWYSMKSWEQMPTPPMEEGNTFDMDAGMPDMAMPEDISQYEAVDYMQ